MLIEIEKEVERWKAIEDYKGLYSISNFGRVYSRPRTRKWINYTHKIQGKILKTYLGSNYINVCLSKDKTKKTFNIHILVATAFIPNPDNLPCVNHIDEDKTNNRVDNLEWVSYRENKCYSRKNCNFTSKYIGVSLVQATKKWSAHIFIDGKLKILGTFTEEIEAYQARIKAEKEYNIKNKYI